MTGRSATSSATGLASRRRYGTGKAALVDREQSAGGAGLTRNAKVLDLSTAWLLDVEASDLARSTKARYAAIVRQFVNPGVGQLRLRELTVPAVDRFLRVIVEKHGASTAKGARSVMSGMVGMALRHGAMTTNPTRDVAPISVPKKIVRALTPGETGAAGEEDPHGQGGQAAGPGRPGRVHAGHGGSDR